MTGGTQFVEPSTKRKSRIVPENPTVTVFLSPAVTTGPATGCQLIGEARLVADRRTKPVALAGHERMSWTAVAVKARAGGVGGVAVLA